MKTERRHELQHNELDRILAQSAEYFQKHGTTILWCVAGVVAVFAGVRFFQNRASSTLQEAYNSFRTLTYDTKENAKASLEQIKSLTEKVSDEAFVLKALSTRATVATAHAVDDATGAVDKDMLTDAQQAYNEITRRFANSPVECGTAWSGLATLEETLYTQDQNLAHKAKAKELLEKVVADNRLAGTPLSTMAVERLNALDKTFQIVTFVEPPPAPLVEAPAEPAASTDAPKPAAAGPAEEPVKDAVEPKPATEGAPE